MTLPNSVGFLLAPRLAGDSPFKFRTIGSYKLNFRKHHTKHLQLAIEPFCFGSCCNNQQWLTTINKVNSDQK